MNKIYIIAPTVLLAIYIFFYRGFLTENEAKVARLEQEKAAIVAAEAAKKADTERKSREDTAKRAADRAAKEKEEADKRLEKFNSDNKKILDDKSGYDADSQRYTKMIADFERELAALRAQKEAVGRENLELLKKVELARIAKRNAELNIQRMTEMISRRAATSSLTTPPPAPASSGRS
ncbi:hypothetical protein MASR2M8_09520 [Opitutaceae bacterium]